MRGTTRPRQVLVLAIEKRNSARATARAYEATLPAEQRKLLGQFFTGMPLGKLLAHLALDSSTRTVLDPMAGHGDLLDAIWEAAEARHSIIERSDGIEIDERTASACRERLTRIVGTHGHTPQHIIAGSSFDIDVLAHLPDEGYDLVITNPPYVRYQARKGFA
jgi:type I restriction-modification system DNA methylase subunit